MSGFAIVAALTVFTITLFVYASLVVGSDSDDN